MPGGLLVAGGALLRFGDFFGFFSKVLSVCLSDGLERRDFSLID